MITLKAADNGALVRELKERFNMEAQSENDTVTFTAAGGKEFLPQFVRESKQPLHSLSMRGPTLDDVFLKVTGRAIREQGAEGMDMMARMMMGRMGGPRR